MTQIHPGTPGCAQPESSIGTLGGSTPSVADTGSTVTDSRIGSIIAGHRLERLVGRSGMRHRLKGVDESLDRTVALRADHARAGRRAPASRSAS